jgi:TadE-like protein
MNTKKDLHRYEQGQGLVEFAFVATLLLILFVGLIDLGRALFTYMALRDAAQEGATYGSIYPGESAAIETRTRDTSRRPVDLTDTSKVNVQINVLGPACAGSGIEVEVTYPEFQLTTPLLSSILGSNTIPIRAKVTDTILTPPCE